MFDEISQSYLSAYMLNIDESFAEMVIHHSPDIYSFQLWIYSKEESAQIVVVGMFGEDWGVKNITGLIPGKFYCFIR